MTEKEKKKEPRKVSTKFTGVLAVISIIGFVNIILESLASYSISEYFDTAWLFIVGVGFWMASRPKNLYEGSKKYFTETSFTRLITFIMALLAITASILSVPEINFSHHTLDTIKSIISFIAILFIIVQTWVMEH